MLIIKQYPQELEIPYHLLLEADPSKKLVDKYLTCGILFGAFYEKELLYTYEEYSVHLEATKQFEKSHTNYHLELNNTHAFRNIQIQIHKGKWAMVSKTKTPTIHFVIRHSKMLNAFENFIAPVIETAD